MLMKIIESVAAVINRSAEVFGTGPEAFSAYDFVMSKPGRSF